MTELKTIDPKAKEFTANGKRYLISEKISTERYKEYEKLVPRMTFGLSFQEIFHNLDKAFQALNKPTPEPVTAGIIIHNVMNGIRAIDDEKRIHPALLMAALVIIREDEDPKTYTEQMMLEKISDWQTEGFDMMSFFALSLGSIQGFRTTLKRYIQESLEVVQKDLEEEVK